MDLYNLYREDTSMSKKCELPNRQKNFWGAAALFCSFAGLIIMFHVCVYTGDNLIAYVAATTATLLISGVYGGMQGWTLAKRNFWDFYTNSLLYLQISISFKKKIRNGCRL